MVARARHPGRIYDMRRYLLLILCFVLTIPAHAVRQPVRARHGMAAAMEGIAADVGVGVLQKGGNAVDAAVAVGFALAVTHPFAGNLGGGGYMLIRMANGTATFIDFRERAPERASRNMYLDAQGNLTRDSIEGWRSSGVPGTVRGFEIAVSKYGKRKWAENMAPAIELASKGFAVSYALAEGLKNSRGLASDPESKRIFQRDGAFYDVGETLVQPELARTLERISTGGPNEFYTGETAKRLVDEMAKHGGLITQSDLSNYKAIERTPLQGAYKNFTVITAPPSSSGGIALL
jgi:gamma-glutamyltranspeptidase / glutathione hydrolase